jgi:hypothetical protein
MKKAVILGMLVGSFVTAPAFAAGKVTIERAKVEDTLKLARAGGANHSAKGTKAVTGTMVRDAMLDMVKVDSAIKPGLENILDNGTAAQRNQRLEALAILSQGREKASTLGSNGDQLDKTVSAITANLSFANRTGLIKSATLDQKTAEAITESLSYLESPEMTKTLLEMNEAPQKKYVAFLEAKSELMKNDAGLSAEEAAIQAMMKVEKIDRTAAIEKLKKIKNCKSA